MTLRRNLAERLSLALYLAATSALAPLLPIHLKKRLQRGREHPDRWREKQGFSSRPRPVGKLVWLHAVGLGEVLALRGMIVALQACDPDLQFLVTSSTRASAETFGNNLPPKTVHQFLPLDCGRYAQRFLDHWHPDLALWSEQDMWPGLVTHTARRGIPQALINVRMTAASFQRKRRVKALYRAVYRNFALISAQDNATATALVHLDAPQDIRIDGSLKPHSPPLRVAAADLARMTDALAGKEVWLAASCHREDEAVALEAHRQLLTKAPNAMLILAPRYPSRAPHILSQLAGFNIKVRSRGALPDARTQVYLADSFAEMGLWYELSDFALIGGTFSDIEGHNPWEALQLRCGVMHGPRYANFTNDFTILIEAQACFPVYNAGDIVDTLMAQTPRGLDGYRRLQRDQSAALSDLAETLIGLIKP